MSEAGARGRIRTDDVRFTKEGPTDPGLAPVATVATAEPDGQQLGHPERRPEETQFWARVVFGNGCWTWAGPCHPSGHGRTTVDGRPWYAHRRAWTLTNGPIPSGLCVCHKCDNPPCVRPDHLFLGTVADNNQDMWRKGRGGRPPRGNQNPNVKLSDAEVAAIRARYTTGGVSHRALAREYGVSKTLVACIIVGRKRRPHVVTRPEPRR